MKFTRFTIVYLCLVLLNQALELNALSQMDATLSGTTNNQVINTITVAILAKDKEHTLPLYLACIEQQTWPAKKTNLYIRTNNNNDNTAQLLEAWIEKVKDRYAAIYFDKTEVVQPIQRYGQHEWNVERFKVLGKIRQESIDWARQMRSHYFVVDCDNFIKPETLEKIAQVNLPVVAPYLRCFQFGDIKNSVYSNYHAAVRDDGYFANCPEYYTVWDQAIKGLIEMPVVHCAYFIRYDVLESVSYDDGSRRHEYVVFSDVLCKKKISQYLDNRQVYGYITFAEDKSSFEQEPWLHEFDIQAGKETSCSKILSGNQELISIAEKNSNS